MMLFALCVLIIKANNIIIKASCVWERLMQIQEIEKKLFHQSLSDLAESLEHDQRLGRVWRLIERDYSDAELNLERAARESGASLNHLNVLLRRTAGFTFHQLLTRYRLLRAIDGMSGENQNLLDVALDSGFGSLSPFERNCRTILGKAPRLMKEN
jgi:AraC-like DNA-binding protein